MKPPHGAYQLANPLQTRDDITGASVGEALRLSQPSSEILFQTHLALYLVIHDAVGKNFGQTHRNRICHHHVDLDGGQRLVERKIRQKGLQPGSLEAVERLDAFDGGRIQRMGRVFRRYWPVRRTDRRGRFVDRVNSPPAPMAGVPVIEFNSELTAKILAYRQGSIRLLVLDRFVQELNVVHAPDHEHALTKLGHPIEGGIQGKLGQAVPSCAEPSSCDSPSSATRGSGNVLHDEP